MYVFIFTHYVCEYVCVYMYEFVSRVFFVYHNLLIDESINNLAIIIVKKKDIKPLLAMASASYSSGFFSLLIT